MTSPSIQVVLDDLSSRFILNIPKEEWISMERIVFQIEMAYWFYCDFYREVHPKLPNLALKAFSLALFRACPLLRAHLDAHERIYAEFQRYKTRVPVCGCIILTPDLSQVLLVKGWTNNAGWGFPKGKINKGESDIDCAVRETWEEIGFDAAGMVREEDGIEVKIAGSQGGKQQRIKLYIVPGVPEDTDFVTQTRKEISVHRFTRGLTANL